MIKSGTLEKVFAQMVAKGIDDVRKGSAKSQRDYSSLAGVAVGVCVMTNKDGVTLLSECMNDIAGHIRGGNAAVAAYCDRLLRNVCICTYAPRSLQNIDSARELTKYWSDFEILQNLNLANGDVRNMLQDWRIYWLDDKQTGFANIPEQYRAAATQGDFGGLIERKLAAAVECIAEAEKTQQRAENEPINRKYNITNEGVEMISTFFTPEFKGEKGGNDWLKRFVKDLEDIINEPKQKKKFAAVLLLALSSERATTNKAHKMSEASWFEMWRFAFGIEKLQYKANQLAPTRYKNQFSYLFS